ncbi:E3 ubiquitin-protein ligase pdzrn3-like [Plakobranchus ocellatus]|uniref:E3 ubiquitin-protein ligase pdzrn3-like n=1 Tax=Plakobranchus ocellatus TaxID=259542 RepID=A0AAV4DK12_9GAST|nr:E3 ubiquitin-protein ligase pdzrn3-like [Plakobranchus ocellatus]
MRPSPGRMAYTGRWPQQHQGPSFAQGLAQTTGTARSILKVQVSETWRFYQRLSPQQGDLRLSGRPSGRSAGGGARTHDRRIPADLRADSLATVPPTPPE